MILSCPKYLKFWIFFIIFIELVCIVCLVVVNTKVMFQWEIWDLPQYFEIFLIVMNTISHVCTLMWIIIGAFERHKTWVKTFSNYLNFFFYVGTPTFWTHWSHLPMQLNGPRMVGLPNKTLTKQNWQFLHRYLGEFII